MNDTEVKQSIVDDACIAQRKRGIMPTPTANEAYIMPILEKFDRQQASAKDKPKAKPAPAKKDTNAIQAEYNRRMRQRGLEPMKAEIVQREAPKKILPKPRMSEWMKQYRNHILLRLRVMKAHPEYKAKVEALAFACTGIFGKEKQNEAIFKIKELIEESGKHFGDWRKWPTNPISFSG